VGEFLAEYRGGSQIREKVVQWGLTAIAVVAIVWAADWALSVSGHFGLRDIREQWQAHRFFSLLSDRKYQPAYAMWGCDPVRPCRDYSFPKFMEDWGPASIAARPSQRKVKAVEHCHSGIIEVIDFGAKKDAVNLYVGSEDLTLSFALYPACTLHSKAESMNSIVVSP
jgi:hypothetical protein